MIEAAPPPRWAVVTWALLIAALIGLFAFAGQYGKRKQARELQTLLFANSKLSEEQLATCLSARMPLNEKGWEVVDGPIFHIRRWNKIRGVRVEILNDGLNRRVIIGTPGKRQLYPQEAEALRRCLAGA